MSNQIKSINPSQTLISRKKIVQDFLYRTYGRKALINLEDEDCWYNIRNCYNVSF